MASSKRRKPTDSGGGGGESLELATTAAKRAKRKQHQEEIEEEIEEEGVSRPEAEGEANQASTQADAKVSGKRKRNVDDSELAASPTSGANQRRSEGKGQGKDEKVKRTTIESSAPADERGKRDIGDIPDGAKAGQKDDDDAKEAKDANNNGSGAGSSSAAESRKIHVGEGEGSLAGVSSGELCTCLSVMDETIELPQEFFTLKHLSQVLNLDTWKTGLEERERIFLRHFLPPTIGSGEAEQEKEGGFLDRLLGGDEKIHFGNPGKLFMRNILSGKCHPSIVKFRSILNDLEYALFFQRLRDHQDSLVFQLMDSKEQTSKGEGEKGRKQVTSVEENKANPPGMDGASQNEPEAT